MVRRRPLLRVAAVGGTFAAGRAMGRRAEERTSAEADQNQRISDLEHSQGGGRQQAPQPQQAQPDAGGSDSMMDQLNQLATMHSQGALSDEEFAAAKAKILGS